MKDTLGEKVDETRGFLLERPPDDLVEYGKIKVRQWNRI